MCVTNQMSAVDFIQDPLPSLQPQKSKNKTNEAKQQQQQQQQQQL